MKHLRLTSQADNLFAAWPTNSNSLGERGGGGSAGKAMPLQIYNLDLHMEQLYFTGPQ